MHASDLLVPPTGEGVEDRRTPRQQVLWDTTYQRIEGVLPGFLAAVIPAPPPPLASSAQPGAPGAAVEPPTAE